MALHLNLYHEIQKQAIARSRDPLKLGLYAVGVVVAFLMIYYFYRLEQVSVLTSQAKKLQAQWDLKTPKAKEALAESAQFSTNLKLREDLTSAIENRYYWAPLLERIQKAVPKNVQITRLHGQMEQGRGTLEITGIGAGPEPRKVAEDFRTSFIEKCLKGAIKIDSKFSSLEDTDATVQLNDKTLNTALFTLQFNFSVAEIVPTTPVATPVKRKGAR